MTNKSEDQVVKPLREGEDSPRGNGFPHGYCMLGTARFSLNGHQLVVVRDLPLAAELDQNASDFSPRLRQAAGCVAVGGDTFTIFSLESGEGVDEGTAARQHPIDFLTQRELQYRDAGNAGKGQ